MEVNGKMTSISGEMITNSGSVGVQKSAKSVSLPTANTKKRPEYSDRYEFLRFLERANGLNQLEGES